MGTDVKVAKLPLCNFCQVKSAQYDFKTQMGPWAYGCEEDYQAFRLYQKLGTGMGQRLVLAP
jgi:hypothetical protein